MINIITYHSQNAPDNLRWLAFVLLPSGKIWDVRFSGATEIEARTNAETLWQKEVNTNRRKEEVVTVSGSKVKFAGKKSDPIVSKENIDPWANLK